VLAYLFSPFLSSPLESAYVTGESESCISRGFNAFSSLFSFYMDRKKGGRGKCRRMSGARLCPPPPSPRIELKLRHIGVITARRIHSHSSESITRSAQRPLFFSVDLSFPPPSPPLGKV